MVLTVRGRPLTTGRLQHRARLFVQRVGKRVRGYAPSDNPRSVVFVLGSQRSGTTMVSQIFAADPGSDVYPERSALSRRDDPDRLRLRPLAEVAEEVARNRASLVVAKPLVESQNALALLAADPDWKLLWMCRDYRDVANSNHGMFGEDNGFKDMAAVVGDAPNWRNEGLPADERARLGALLDGAGPGDAAALFWLSRNLHFFRQGLQDHPRVWLCDYGSLVSDPEAEMARIYAFLGRRRPARAQTGLVHRNSVGSGQRVPLAPATEAACAEMLVRLQAARAAQLAALPET